MAILLQIPKIRARKMLRTIAIAFLQFVRYILHEHSIDILGEISSAYFLQS